MKKLLFKRIFSVFLLLIFFYSTTPHDFLHELFANHKDTIDQPVGNIQHVSKKHIHCAFLSIKIAHYVNSYTPYYPSILAFYYLMASALPVGYHCKDILTASLRAPPVTA